MPISVRHSPGIGELTAHSRLALKSHVHVSGFSVLFDADCVAPELREAAMQYNNLVSYTERIRGAYFEGELTWEETSSFGGA